MLRLVLALLAVTVIASAANAGGMNLAWNDCGIFGTQSATFACNSNSGTNRLYASFVPPANLPELLEALAVIDLTSSEPVLSQWWSLQSGGCRVGSLSAFSDFTAGPFSCADPWLAGAVTGQVYNFQFSGRLNGARIRAFAALPLSSPVSVDTSHEYYAVGINLGHQKSVGTGSCAGCADGICFVLQSVELTQTPGTGDYVVTNPLLSQAVTFQASAPPCPGATPARARTWGGIKTLYR